MRKLKALPMKRKLSEDFPLAAKTESAEYSDEDSKDTKTAPKLKVKREPLPMKMRAFPQSFWQEPNASGIVLPTNCCSPLEEENERISQSYVVGNANTDLLFSLFQNVSRESEKVKQVPVVKRGRPRKAKTAYQPAKTAKDEDPYFTSAIVPVIHVKDEEKIAQEQQVLRTLLDSYQPDNDGEREKANPGEYSEEKSCQSDKNIEGLNSFIVSISRRNFELTELSPFPKLMDWTVLAFISVAGEAENFPVNNSYSERLTDLVVNL